MLKKCLILFILLFNIKHLCFSQNIKEYRFFNEPNQNYIYIYDYFQHKKDAALKYKRIGIGFNQTSCMLLTHNTIYHNYTWQSIAITSFSLINIGNVFIVIAETKKHNYKQQLKYVKKKKPLRLIKGSNNEIIYLE